MGEEFRLTTPEAVSISYPIAGIGTRFIAAVLDVLIIIAAEIAVLVGIYLVGQLGGIFTTIATILGLTLSFLLFWGYFVLFETLWSGQTPGKRALHIRVIKTSGYPIGFVDAIIRNLVRIVDFLPSLYAIGLVTMFISYQSRRLGDYAAGTIVIKEGRRIDLSDLQTAPAPVTANGSVQACGSIDPDELGWDLGALSPDTLHVMTEFLARAPALPSPARRRLGEEIGGHIATVIGAREPFDMERFLKRVLELREEEGQR